MKNEKQTNTISSFTENCTVVLSAGGEGSRFRSVPGAEGVQKAAFLLPTGETMIERTIKIYRDLGIKEFAILVYHHATTVREVLGDGSKLGVRISYSEDPEKPVGRGGAMKNAFENGTVARSKYLIVHNPDDQLVGDTGEIVRGAIAAHLENEEKFGALATAILVPGTPYEFTGFQIEDGRVTGAEMYPFVPIPAHIGMTIFSPSIALYFDRLFDITKKSDFEAVVFPVLTEEKKLGAHFIPAEAWISVNDEKGLKKLIKTLEDKA